MFDGLEISELQSKVRIRVIDDDKDFLKSMGLLLEMTGWNVITFNSAKDFLETENFIEPGCILLDLRMPEMTGLELQRKLLSQNKNHLPIIFLTGHGDVESAVYTLKNGAFDFLQKPVNPLVLNKVVVEASQKSLSTLPEADKRKKISPVTGHSHRGKKRSSGWQPTAKPTKRFRNSWILPFRPSKCIEEMPLTSWMSILRLRHLNFLRV